MSDRCFGRTGTGANHCWHSTVWAQMSNPPRYGERCCYCGERRWITADAPPSVGHGPFATGASLNDMLSATATPEEGEDANV